jgi:hypothetical protein
MSTLHQPKHSIEIRLKSHGKTLNMRWKSRSHGKNPGKEERRASISMRREKY